MKLVVLLVERLGIWDDKAEGVGPSSPRTLRPNCAVGEIGAGASVCIIL